MLKMLKTLLFGEIIVLLNLLMLVKQLYNKMEFHIRINQYYYYRVKGLVADDAWL